MKEFTGYITLADSGANAEVEIPGDKGSQFIMTDIFIVSDDSSDCRVWDNMALGFGAIPPKVVTPLVLGGSDLVLSSLNTNLPVTEDIQIGDKLAVRIAKGTQLMVKYCDVLNVDVLNKTVTTDWVFDAEDLLLFGVGSDVIKLEQNKIPMVGSAPYKIDRTGECVGSISKSCPGFLKVYGTNTKIMITGYWDDEE